MLHEKREREREREKREKREKRVCLSSVERARVNKIGTIKWEE
jgi:hypothetical protein